MYWETSLTLLVVVGIFVGLLRNLASPAALMFVALAVLLTAGSVTGTDRLITSTEAVAGFGNTGLVTVGLLFVVVSGLVHTGAVTMITEPIVGRPKRLLTAQLRMLFPVSALSAFLNNTPIVAMFLPVVDDLAKRSGLSASKLFLPLSYASILGGMCTLIGTSTNLVVNGMLTEQAHLPGVALFDLAWVGVPIAVIGLTYIFAASGWLLPSAESSISLDDDPRRYTAEVVVEAGGPLVGKTVEAAGLRHLPGLFLAEIERDGEVLPAVSPTERLRSNDRLVFVGVVESVVDLYRIRGLQPATNQVFKLREPREERCMVEAVVSDRCPLVGKSIREGRFRTEYNAAVMAVARGGRRLRGKIGDIVLQPGDTLLLETHPNFLDVQRNARDFFLVSGVEDSAPRRHERAWLAFGVLGGMVALAASGAMSMLNAALLGACAMIISRCATLAEAKRQVDWNVLLVIGAALGVGQAIANSGAGALLAGGLIEVSGGNPWLVLASVFLVTTLFTELITNNAAAVIVFPITVSAAERLDADPTAFVITLMIAASASFSSPLGYQTNLMVFGPGGYHVRDYLRFGIPLNIIAGVVTVALAPLVWPLFPSAG